MCVFIIIQVNDELCRLMGVQCNITSAYHPQSNGLDERFNQTLQRQLLKFVNEEQTDWDLYLDAILFSYRTSRQDSTKMSPFYLVYGRQARLPLETAVHPGNQEPDEGVKTEEVNLDEHVAKMVAVRRKALENICNAQERQKQQYNAKHSRDKGKYKVGALVLLKNSKKLSRKGSKMEPNWLGPYRIHKVLNKGTFQLCKTSNKKVLTQLYNMTRLKLYYPPSELGTSPGDENQDPSLPSPSPDPTLSASSQDPALSSPPHSPSLTQNFVSSLFPPLKILLPRLKHMCHLPLTLRLSPLTLPPPLKILCYLLLTPPLSLEIFYHLSLSLYPLPLHLKILYCRLLPLKILHHLPLTLNFFYHLPLPQHSLFKIIMPSHFQHTYIYLSREPCLFSTPPPASATHVVIAARIVHAEKLRHTVPSIATLGTLAQTATQLPLM